VIASVEETTKLVDGIVRLRRAERLPGAAEDVGPVRRDLETRAGPTLSRFRASRLLGVSQTAFDRWVGAGQIPIVVTSRGRHEVPLQFVVELREAIGKLKSRGITRHPLASALGERRAAAEELDVAPGPGGRGGRTPQDHRTANRRALAYHRLVADRLDDRAIGEARARVARLAAEDHLSPHYADRWQQVLALPPEAIADRITEDSQDGRDLRQNSPFAGALNEQERRRVIELVR
jgi:hypothetical protein